MINKIALSILMALLFTVLLAVPAFAIDAPDSINIKSVMAFRNLAESGDMLIVFHYLIDYDTYPDVPASNSILFRLYSANGTDLLTSSTPYVFFAFDTNGYGDGVGSFYFSANESITWGQSYQINILCLPSHFDPPQSFTHTMNASEYSDSTTQSENQVDMYDYIMSLCDTFGSIYSPIVLKTGLVLSVYGENYFRGAIPGLQSLCPHLFFVQTYVPEIIEVEYDMSLQDTYTDRLEGSDLMRGAERIGDVLGISGKFFLAMGNFALCIGASVLTMRKGWGIEAGLFFGALITVCSAILIGDAIFTVLMVASLIAAIGIIYVFVLKRA